MSSVASLKSRKRRSLTEPVIYAIKSPAERNAELISMLDDTHRTLLDSQGNRDHVATALSRIFGGLERQKASCTADEWQSCIQTCRDHGLLATLHEDPFTGRAYAKPRGYAGDAELLDLIYLPEERWPDPIATPLGLDIYRYTNSAPAAEGVRARRGFVADLIDQTASEKRGRDILAIAAGHLREANLTTALKRRRVGRFVALDADPISLKEIDRAYGAYGVETVPSSFSALITNRLKLGTFDLIYSTGLFDYLSANTGRRLVTTLFDMLKPGGQLVVANFMPGIRDIGFMETFMDWKLIYRTRQDMVDLTMEIDESEIRDLAIFAAENRNIIFLKISKQ